MNGTVWSFFCESILYSRPKYSSIFTLSQTELLNVDHMAVFWWLPERARLAHITRTRRKRQKRSETAKIKMDARSESNGGLGRGKPPFSLPRLPLRSRRSPIFFFPLCEPGPRLGFPALVRQKQVLFLLTRPQSSLITSIWRGRLERALSSQRS